MSAFLRKKYRQLYPWQIYEWYMSVSWDHTTCDMVTENTGDSACLVKPFALSKKVVCASTDQLLSTICHRRVTCYQSYQLSKAMQQSNGLDTGSGVKILCW